MGKTTMTVTITVGVLALQGGFHEHLTLLRRAVSQLSTTKFALVEVRTSQQLAQCDALIIPGGESTTMSLVAGQTDLFDKGRRTRAHWRPVRPRAPQPFWSSD